MEGIQTLKGSWPWPWPSIRPYRIPSCITHRPVPIYRMSFKLKKLFVDGRTYGRTDISPLYIIRSTFGSRPKKDIDLLETVQQRATRLMTSDKSLSYTDQLQKFGLTTLETKKLQSDLIEVFKMFKWFLQEMISSSYQAQLWEVTHSTSKPHVHLDVRKFFHS